MQTENDNDGGCAYLLDPDPEGCAVACGAGRRPGSPYCPEHHARCRVPARKYGEVLRLREIEALAQIVGGRYGRPAPQPPKWLLRRLARASRAALRPNRSRFVSNGGTNAETDPQ